MKIVAVLLTTIVWYFCIRESIYLTRDMKNWKYVDDDKLHSLQHISILLGAVILSSILVISTITCPYWSFTWPWVVLLLLDLYIMLIVYPHVSDERIWEKLKI